MSDELKPEQKPEEAIPQDDQELKDLLNSLQNEPMEPDLVEPEPMPDPQQLTPVAAQEVQPTTEQQQQINSFARKFTDVANGILDNFKEDRDQIDDTIKYLENIVHNGSGQRVHVEMLVASQRTKAEATASAVKLLDSYAKFLAATKGTSIFVQNNNTSIQDDLKQILAKPLYLDEIKDAKNK